MRGVVVCLKRFPNGKDFNLSETEVITAAIIVGYPAKELPLTPRKPESEIIFFKE